MPIAVMTSGEPDGGLALCEGIAEEMNRSKGDDLFILAANQEALLEKLIRERRLSGVIGAFISDRWLEGFGKERPPMVNCANASHITAVPSVAPDDAAVGALAARAFHGAGLKHALCLTLPAMYFSRLREKGFSLAAAEGGMKLFPADTPLQCLPRPCGVYAVDDALARRFIVQARRGGFSVPGDFAVLGTGGYAAENLLSPVPLSSISLARKENGARAARLLNRLLSGGEAPGVTLLPPGGVVARASTALPGSGDPFLDRALTLMEGALDRPPDIAWLARAAGLSRRGLETRFSLCLRTSPAAEWRRLQREAALRLIRSSSRSIDEIARACGWVDAAHLAQAFRKAGLGTPGSHRLD